MINLGPETIRCYNDPQDYTGANTCKMCDEEKDEDMPEDICGECEACEREEGRIEWEDGRDQPGVEFVDMLDTSISSFIDRRDKWGIAYVDDMQLAGIEVLKGKTYDWLGSHFFKMKQD